MKRIDRISVTHIAGILYVVCKLTEGYISGSKVSQAVHIVTTVSTSDQYADHAFMVETCDSVRDRCVSDPSCEMLLHSIKTFCANVVTGESSTCTEQCSRALFKMAMRAYSDFALDFVNCDCNGSFTCQSMKGLIETCTKSVVTLIKGAQSGYAYSCRLGWWICAQDPECELARITSELECRTMLDGIECTSSCNSSIGHLFRQPSAVVLSNCV
ncbi:uncharacterized protein LOC127852680 [Dreissena polymorpha]|nr:uncharacterized protein LOC127852680 [Dreissena polymorpha]